mmetsp:Transcript_4851/g.9248  ORF Transcript_4851/g.9248 Transcript_4851/m.9248 type:complete len:358 (-) Transcript_4851:42-1115(-)
MSSPQPNNRFREHYESFYNTTPLTTRIVLISTTITYLASFLYDPSFILANIPAFTLLKIQLYRIFTSFFICTELLSLVFAFLSFLDYGKRIESGIGSTNFAAVLLSISGITNMIHNLLCLIGYFLTSRSEFLFIPSVGIWNLILAVISMECATADHSSQRRLFIVDVPTRYYPCVLLGFFCLLNGGQIHLSYFISVGVGYLMGFGKLDYIKLSTERRQRLEAGVLRKFTSKVGFVAGPHSNSWNLATMAISGAISVGNGNGHSSEPSTFRSNVFNASSNNDSNKSVQVPTFGGTMGNRLGSSTGSTNTRSRPNATASQSNPGPMHTVDRSVLVAAAERRAAASVASVKELDEENGKR